MKAFVFFTVDEKSGEVDIGKVSLTTTDEQDIRNFDSEIIRTTILNSSMNPEAYEWKEDPNHEEGWVLQDMSAGTNVGGVQLVDITSPESLE